MWQAALGDVQLSHQLHARNDGGFHFPRWRLLIEQHAVHTVTNAEFLLERLDVNVAGALFHRLRDHRIHQADHRRLARHIAKLLQVRAGLARVQFGFGFLALRLAVVFVDGVEDFGICRKRGLDLKPAHATHCRDGFEIQRVRHGNGQRGIIQSHRNEPALAHEGRRNTVDFGSCGRGRVESHQRDHQLIGKCRQHIPRGNESEVYQDLAELVAAFLLQFQGALQVFHLDQAPLNQEFAEPHQSSFTLTTPGGRGWPARAPNSWRRSARITIWVGSPEVSSQEK